MLIVHIIRSESPDSRENASEASSSSSPTLSAAQAAISNLEATNDRKLAGLTFISSVKTAAKGWFNRISQFVIKVLAYPLTLRISQSGENIGEIFQNQPPWKLKEGAKVYLLYALNSRRGDIPEIPELIEEMQAELKNKFPSLDLDESFIFHEMEEQLADIKSPELQRKIGVYHYVELILNGKLLEKVEGLISLEDVHAINNTLDVMFEAIKICDVRGDAASIAASRLAEVLVRLKNLPQIKAKLLQWELELSAPFKAMLGKKLNIQNYTIPVKGTEQILEEKYERFKIATPEEKEEIYAYFEEHPADIAKEYLKKMDRIFGLTHALRNERTYKGDNIKNVLAYPNGEGLDEQAKKDFSRYDLIFVDGVLYSNPSGDDFYNKIKGEYSGYIAKMISQGIFADAASPFILGAQKINVLAKGQALMSFYVDTLPGGKAKVTAKTCYDMRSNEDLDDIRDDLHIYVPVEIEAIVPLHNENPKPSECRVTVRRYPSIDHLR